MLYHHECNADNLIDIEKSFFKAFAPPPNYTISTWADDNRYVAPSTSPRPGKWSTKHTSYLKYPMDQATNPVVKQIFLMFASQTGKSEILINVIGYYIDADPSSMLFMLPTDDGAKNFSKERIEPNIKCTPTLAAKINVDKKSKDNNVDYKAFPGGYMALVGSNVAHKLASRPIRVLITDEGDRAAKSADGEGSPFSLARKRQSNYWNAIEVSASTPTIKGNSFIETEYLSSSMHRYHIPCPECHHSQYLKWKNVKWHDNNAETAYYACEECGSAWDDVMRSKAIDKGEWKAEHPEIKHKLGFHLPRFSSGFCKLRDVVSEFLKAKEELKKGDSELMIVWVNTVLAETWEDKSEGIESHILKQRVEMLPEDTVPEHACLVTGGVDVQPDRLELLSMAWAEGEEAWILDYKRFYGDPTKKDVWKELEEFCGKYYYSDHFKRNFKIERLAVDSGFLPSEVLKFCYEGNRLSNCHVYPTKGMPGDAHPLFKRSRYSKKHKSREFFALGVNDAKDIILKALSYQKHGPGFWHFPDRCDDEFFEQLTSERKRIKFIRGFEMTEWFKPNHVRNEVLDLAVLNLFAMRISNTDFAGRMRNYKQTENKPKMQTGFLSI